MVNDILVQNGFARLFNQAVLMRSRLYCPAFTGQLSSLTNET